MNLSFHPAADARKRTVTMIKFRKIILISVLLSIALGFGVTQISWGDPKGFHGIGVPFASVYWDFIDGSTYPMDFPNPYAPLLNSVAVFFTGSMVIGTGWLVVSHLRKRRLRVQTETT